MHPYLTAGIPGTGGNIKEVPEDFVVEEIRAYKPCGTGEHLFLNFEKRGITTLEAVRRVAGALKIAERDVGYAGMKDAVGITRQTISLQKVKESDVFKLKLDGITVLSAARHTNKLKLGHLKGNHFQLVIRGVTETAIETAFAVLKVLQQRGVPNFFGNQRYGAQRNSHLIGAAMLRRNWQDAVGHMIGEPASVRDEEWGAAISAFHQGDLTGALRRMPWHCRNERDVIQQLISRPGEWERAFSVIHPRLKKLYLSAVQSFLFDRVVAQRLPLIDQIQSGDLAWKHLNGACFLVKDASVEAHRAEAFEISASGPMFGCRMTQPAGNVFEVEQRLLAEAGFSCKDCDLGGSLRLDGERRPLRVPLTDVSCHMHGNSLQLKFSLPRGSYATSVVREITKTC